MSWFGGVRDSHEPLPLGSLGQDRLRYQYEQDQRFTIRDQQLAEATIGMAQTPEAKVKKKVRKLLDELGAYSFPPQTGGYGASGVPDIVGCYRGVFFGIECKAGKNKPTALQEKHLREIVEAGGFACVVNEENADSFAMLLVARANKEEEEV